MKVRRYKRGETKISKTLQKTEDWAPRTPLWSGLNSGAPEDRRHDHQPFMEIVLNTSIHK